MPQIAVIGGGLVGLSTALCLLDSLPQCPVTIISEAFSPNTTGDVAAGCLIPHTYPDTPVQQQKEWFKETFDHLFKIAISPEASIAGVSLLSGFRSRGGMVQTQRVNNVWDLHGKYDIIVNCSGIGSRDLFGDTSLYPVKGQVVQVHAPWLTHFIRDGDGSTYIYPGRSSTTLGGTRQKHNWKLLPDEKTSKEILNRCSALEPSLQGSRVVQEKVGLRPVRSSIRLEKEMIVRNGHRLPVVHNYGHGGGGFSVHIGTAKAATRLVEELLNVLNDITKSKL
ncbi:hypothetical protein GDO86_009728 [Hymenochirus boettgeri]|uniref:D-aspartate oxidase n=1 Tax=Hymenochirus boettgeri TaxID=247094 RepID=A0A8T2JHM1_9PIPI|nr:hypothetical protein GDO86_009728 [Hymenochirus boettgeri]